MADTERTLAELLAICADNTTGDISPQDLRDVIISLSLDYGECYLTMPAATAIAQAQTFIKLAGATVEGSLADFTMPASNRLQHIGALVHKSRVEACVSLISAANNQEIRIAIAKNGVVVPSSVQHHFIASGADVSSTNLQCIVELAMNDFVEVWVANWTSASNVTAVALNMLATGQPAS